MMTKKVFHAPKLVEEMTLADLTMSPCTSCTAPV